MPTFLSFSSFLFMVLLMFADGIVPLCPKSSRLSLTMGLEIVASVDAEKIPGSKDYRPRNVSPLMGEIPNMGSMGRKHVNLVLFLFCFIFFQKKPLPRLYIARGDS